MFRFLALAGTLALGFLAAADAATYYGTTYGGGVYGKGAVYAFTRGAHPDRAILYSFCAQPDCIDGGHPLSNIVIDADGAIIGMTSMGGAPGAGTIFRLSPAPDGTWSETTLFDFCLSFGQCGRFGRASGTLTLTGPHKIIGTVSDKDGRGAVWSFDWGPWGEVFSPLQYWDKSGH